MSHRNPYQRTDRVGDQIQRELADLFLRGVKDPRIGFLSVTGVEVSPDLGLARVYVSIYGTESDQSGTLQGLESASGYLRAQLKRRLHLKRIPELQFHRDDSIERGAKINAALADLEV